MRALSLLVFLALAGSATAAVLSGGGEAGARASAIAAAGSFSFTNSRGGMPIFSATGIAPGDSVSGSVEIADIGGEPGELTLTQHDVSDIVGSGGGRLSERLSVRIVDITAPAEPVTIYEGPLAPMPAQSAGRVAAGDARTYEFVATLPEGASAAGAGAQNDVQGAVASVAYTWTTGEVTAEPALPPSPPSSSPGQLSPGSGDAGSNPASAPLRLRIVWVRPSIRRGRLLVLARCDRPCVISGRGRLSAGGAAGRRAAKVRLNPRPGYVAGTQRLGIRIPGHVRRWLRAHPTGVRARARIVLTARDAMGKIARGRRTLRLTGDH
ncbi:MAG TPA: hypothetical protein VGO13_05820 [Solirubrobacterales bacterium]|nr:hypothetical protein [Solirubrobacterales bacterium]